MRNRTKRAHLPVIDRTRRARRDARQVLLPAFVVAAFACVSLFIGGGTPDKPAPIAAASSEMPVVTAPSESAPRTAEQLGEAYGRLPLSFEANRGQADESVNFVARGAGYTLALSPTKAVFGLRNSDCGSRNEDAARRTLKTSDRTRSEASPQSAICNPQSAVLQMNLVGANRAATVAGVDELEGRVNYFTGNDPAKWRTDIPTFGRVRYTQVYQGIDVVYYGNQ